ncbi:class I tRNA ligase family protein, partial [Candidatus Pacearchaeota archaeon]|nr:class I tRNA ligase family protein [Candidatus Pacearchaeota archaeon]
CPHITEELWEKIGNKQFISLAAWPICDEKKINEELEKQEQQINQTVNDIQNILKIMREKQNKGAERVYIYLIPKELPIYQQHISMVEKSTGLKTELFAVNDSKKYDPQNKAQKAKPGKPAIYLE